MLIRLCLPGAEYLGRHYECPVSGCAALCSPELRNGSPCLLYPREGRSSVNTSSQQADSLIQDSIGQGCDVCTCFIVFTVPALRCIRHFLIGPSGQSSGPQPLWPGGLCPGCSCQSSWLPGASSQRPGIQPGSYLYGWEAHSHTLTVHLFMHLWSRKKWRNLGSLTPLNSTTV